MPIAEPGTYMQLPSGTRVLWGAVDDTTETLKLLKDADGVGTIGKTAGFVEVTRLIDTEKKFISDMPEGEDKEFMFWDDPADADLQGLITAAEANETVKIRVEFPNGRWSDLIVVLSGWRQEEPTGGEALKVAIVGKQNGLTRGVTA